MNQHERLRQHRLRVFIGYTLLALLAVAAMAIAALPLHAADGKLVVAHVPGPDGQPPIYTTALELLATPDLVAETRIDISRCVVGPSGASLHVTPGGANYLSGLGSNACIDSPFLLLTIPPPTVTAKTIISFRYGQDRNSFTLPPIGAVAGDQVVTIGPCNSDDFEGCYLSVFPIKADTPFLVRLRDARGEAPDRVEMFKASPPVEQYRIQAKGLFWLDVQLGVGIPAPYGCWPEASCDVYGEVYGFGNSGSPDGGNLRPYPFPVAP